MKQNIFHFLVLTAVSLLGFSCTDNPFALDVDLSKATIKAGFVSVVPHVKGGDPGQASSFLQYQNFGIDVDIRLQNEVQKEDYRLFLKVDIPEGMELIYQNIAFGKDDSISIARSGASSLSFVARASHGGSYTPVFRVIGQIKKFTARPVTEKKMTTIQIVENDLNKMITTTPAPYYPNDAFSMNIRIYSSAGVLTGEVNKVRLLGVPSFLEFKGAGNVSDIYIFGARTQKAQGRDYDVDLNFPFVVRGQGEGTIKVVFESSVFGKDTIDVPVKSENRTFNPTVTAKNNMFFGERVPVTLAVSGNSKTVKYLISGTYDGTFTDKNGRPIPINIYQQMELPLDSFYFASAKLGEVALTLDFQNEDGVKVTKTLPLQVLPSGFNSDITFIPPGFFGLDATKEETYEYNDGKYLLEYNSTNPTRMTMKAKLELLPNQKANKVRIALKGGDTVLVTDDGSYYDLPDIAPNEKYTLLYEADSVADNTFTLRLKNGSGVERQVVQTLTVKKSTFKVVPTGNRNILYTDKTLITITINDPNPKSKFVWSVTSNKEPLSTIHFPQGEQTGDRFYYQSAGEDGVHRISVKGRRLNDGVVVDSFIEIQINDPRFSIEAPVLSNNDLHINDSSEVTFDVVPYQSGTLHNFEIALVASDISLYTLHSLKENSKQYTVNSTNTQKNYYTWFSLNDIAQVTEKPNKYKLKLKTKSVPGEGIKFIINVRNGNQSLEKLPVDESVTFDVKAVPLSFTGGEKEANGNETLSRNGWANVPIKVKFTNTTNYPQGKYTWSVFKGGGKIDQDGNFEIKSAESSVDVTIRLSEANTGQVKDVTYSFFFKTPKISVTTIGNLRWFSNATKEMVIPVTYSSEYAGEEVEITLGRILGVGEGQVRIDGDTLYYKNSTNAANINIPIVVKGKTTGGAGTIDFNMEVVTETIEIHQDNDILSLASSCNRLDIKMTDLVLSDISTPFPDQNNRFNIGSRSLPNYCGVSYTPPYGDGTTQLWTESGSEYSYRKIDDNATRKLYSSNPYELIENSSKIRFNGIYLEPTRIVAIILCRDGQGDYNGVKPEESKVSVSVWKIEDKVTGVALTGNHYDYFPRLLN